MINSKVLLFRLKLSKTRLSYYNVTTRLVDDLVGLCWLKPKFNGKSMLGKVLIVDLDDFF